MAAPEIFITGSGVFSCAGTSPQELWETASAGRTGIGSDGIGRLAPDDNAKNQAVDFSMNAIVQAMARAGWNQLNDDDGLILATTTGQIPVWDKVLVSFLKKEVAREEFDQAFVHQPIGNLLDALCARLDFHGRSFLTATACTASTQAIALGAEWIKQGRVKRCLVVGTEVLCTLTLEGFRSLQLLSNAPTKPFDVERNGINLAEGSAALCLESSPRKALAKIDGFGFSTDGFHMTAPDPTGGGSLTAMKAALSSARLSPQDISWVHAHGTGSHHNDVSEGKAIETFFGENAPPVTSTKGVHGHCLGASGVIETVLCLEALNRQCLIRTLGLDKPDPAIHLNHVRENASAKINHILKMTLGFGGANAALVLSRPDLHRET